jgi:N-acetyltransferase
MWITPITLEGTFVRLEPLQAIHAPGLLSAADRALFQFTPQGPDEWSVDGFRRDIERLNAMHDVVAFAIVSRAKEVVVGRTTYMDIQPQHRGIEIGRTWISSSCHGTVVNPETKYLMLRHAFEDRGAIRVEFKTGVDNLHSQRAIAKLGCVREGVLRQDRLLANGRARDSVVFSIVDHEWPEIKTTLEGRITETANAEMKNTRAQRGC